MSEFEVEELSGMLVGKLGCMMVEELTGMIVRSGNMVLM